jgi:hypothetical protein
MFSFLFIDISRANLDIYFVSEKKRGIIFPSPYEAEGFTMPGFISLLLYDHKKAAGRKCPAAYD